MTKRKLYIIAFIATIVIFFLYGINVGYHYAQDEAKIFIRIWGALVELGTILFGIGTIGIAYVARRALKHWKSQPKKVESSTV